MVESVHRGSGPISRNVGAEDEEGVVLQREMGLVSGISLIVGRTTVQLIVLSEQCVSIYFSEIYTTGTIVGSGIWQTAGQTMWASG